MRGSLAGWQVRARSSGARGLVSGRGAIVRADGDCVRVRLRQGFGCGCGGFEMQNGP